MKNLIIILCTRIYVDILGFPVYLTLFVEPNKCTKPLNDPRPFNSSVKLQNKLIKQH